MSGKMDLEERLFPLFSFFGAIMGNFAEIEELVVPFPPFTYRLRANNGTNPSLHCGGSLPRL
jgi:hypothetical protein